MADRLAGSPAGWRRATIAELLAAVGASGACEGRPRVVAVDGRGAAGKSTLARRLAAASRSAAVVHTDDIAWHLARFQWADAMESGILGPLSHGDAVSFRPPGWRGRGRAGAIGVPAGVPLVLVEGSGAGRRRFAPHIDALVWVQVTVETQAAREAQRIRDGHDTEEFVREWQVEERAFFAGDRPWTRADVVVAGDRSDPGDPEAVWIWDEPDRSRLGEDDR